MSTKVDLQSIAETHEKPFLIINKDFVIVAANAAFLDAYGTSLAQVLGRTCHEATHGNVRPCYELGEECPNQRILETGEPHACLHVHTHYDQGRHIHQVRVKGFPLRLEDGELYYGELYEELAVHQETTDDPGYMVGSSKAFLVSLEAMKVAARSDAPVLIQGETGTGKELAASFVHRSSARAHGPFLTLDCTVLTETLVESELFGHARGAFTGSVGDRQGLFKLADGGTLFLDEIGELSTMLQTKLLRVLENGEFRRVGSDIPIRSDVRIICATNRNLAREVHGGRFREDLYYRLACLGVDLPSLRERREDIPALAALLLRRIPRAGECSLTLTEEATAVLMRYDFPGNVRELRNILQAASARATGTTIDAGMVERTISGRPSAGIPIVSGDSAPPRAGPNSAAPSSGDASLQGVERGHLQHLLEVHAGDRAEIASALGVSVRTVYRKLKRYGLR